MDPHADHFLHSTEAGLCDAHKSSANMEEPKIKQWRDIKEAGSLSSFRLLEDSDRLKSYVGQGGLSNHCLTFLQVEKDENNPVGPFQFIQFCWKMKNFIRL